MSNDACLLRLSPHGHGAAMRDIYSGAGHCLGAWTRPPRAPTRPTEHACPAQDSVTRVTLATVNGDIRKCYVTSCNGRPYTYTILHRPYNTKHIMQDIPCRLSYIIYLRIIMCVLHVTIDKQPLVNICILLIREAWTIYRASETTALLGA